jgi:hypothetical protein
MAQDTLEHILEEIRNLTADELRQVERTVRGLLKPTSPETDREAALRVLQDSGMVREIKRPSMVPRPQRLPVPIQGKPLSETIIEERR